MGNASRTIARKAKQAAGKAHGAAIERDALRAQVDRLYMITEAMWALLKRSGGFSDAELGELIEEIDLRDGALDGRSVKAPGPCAKCGRAVSKRTRTCLYCGERPDADAVF